VAMVASLSDPRAIRRPSHPTCAANDARCDHSLERGQHSSAAAAVAPRWGSTLATAAGPAFAVSVPHTRRFVLGCEDSSPGRSRGPIRRCPYTQPPRGTGQAVTRGSSAALCRLCGRCFVTTPPNLATALAWVSRPTPELLYVDSRRLFAGRLLHLLQDFVQ